LKFKVTLRKELEDDFTIEVCNSTDTLVTFSCGAQMTAIKVFEALLSFARAIKVLMEEDLS